jgi:hypothetical protein
MKRIVLCLDGTWNTVTKNAEERAKPTNVVRFAQSVMPVAEGVPQIAYYNAGVGTDGPVDKVLGGVFGVGLKRNVQRAYMFTALNYQHGDEIYIFGFSRGAYTARAVAGIIGRVGLVYPRHFDRFEDVWDNYRARKQTDLADRTVPIKCVGVWDTVGSYGIPAGYGLGALARMFTWRELHFHDTSLGHKIDVGLHAMAIDEHRRPFAPTPWTQKIGEPLPGHQTCEQVWFAGAHSNVGGGYAQHGLSDVAMAWMMGRVMDLTGLRFDASLLKGEAKPDPLQQPADSLSWFYLLSRCFPFNRPMLKPHALDIGLLRNREDPTRRVVNEAVHWSVPKHLGTGKYNPKNLPRPVPPEAVTRPSPAERAIWQALARPLPD